MSFWRRATVALILKEAHGRGPCRFLEATHTIEILPMRAVLICLSFRVHARRSNGADGVGEIIRAKSSSQNNWCSDMLGDVAAEGPIVSHAERPYLTVGFPVAVQE